LAKHHLNEHGTNLVPLWDIRYGTEDALKSWYPHWDLYMLKVFRRAGATDAIVRWLSNVQNLLEHLGYVPEFFALDSFRKGRQDAWRDHGAYANLNCQTGIYRAILEGIVGLECDHTGLSLVPLALPIEHIAVHNISYFGTRWNVDIHTHGPRCLEVRIDGEELRGSMNIPSHFYDGGIHQVSILYGDEPPAGPTTGGTA
jgi:hypothetical protein